MVLGQAAGQPGRAAYYSLCHLLSLPHVTCEMGTTSGISQGSGQVDRMASDEALGPCRPSVDDSSSLTGPRQMEISSPAWAQSEAGPGGEGMKHAGAGG